MTNQEFSDEFDILYNNITSNQAPGLDEYEKSVFLTKALDEIIKAYFNPKSNKVLEGFDGSERRLIDFSMLVKSYTYKDTLPEIELPLTQLAQGNIYENMSVFNSAKYDRHSNSKSIKLLSDILMLLNEEALVTRDNKDIILLIIPILYAEYSRLMSKPYKRPLKWKAWRLINHSSDNYADIIVGPNDTIKEYDIRYVKRPNPIIISALEGVTIGGYVGCDNTGKLVTSNATKGSECELDPILHHEILQRAVELAKAVWAGDLASATQIGSVSSTEKGIIPQLTSK